MVCRLLLILWARALHTLEAASRQELLRRIQIRVGGCRVEFAQARKEGLPFSGYVTLIPKVNTVMDTSFPDGDSEDHRAFFSCSRSCSWHVVESGRNPEPVHCMALCPRPSRHLVHPGDACPGSTSLLAEIL